MHPKMFRLGSLWSVKVHTVECNDMHPKVFRLGCLWSVEVHTKYVEMHAKRCALICTLKCLYYGAC